MPSMDEIAPLSKDMKEEPFVLTINRLDVELAEPDEISPMPSRDKTPKHIKLDERNHVELPLLEQLNTRTGYYRAIHVKENGKRSRIARGENLHAIMNKIYASSEGRN